jgi:hypothetical protein
MKSKRINKLSKPAKNHDQTLLKNHHNQVNNKLTRVIGDREIHRERERERKRERKREQSQLHEELRRMATSKRGGWISEPELRCEKGGNLKINYGKQLL